MTDGRNEPERVAGLTLDEAWETYVSRELQIRFLAAMDRCPQPYNEDRLALMARAEWYLNSPRALAYEAMDRAWRAVWSDLIARLVSGELVGLVFDEYPIRLDSERRRVSARMWRHALYLGSDIEIHGVLYRDARIWRSADLEESVGEPNAGPRGDVQARQKLDLKVLVEMVVRDTPAAAAILAGAAPAHGGIRKAVREMMEDSRLAAANMESVEKEFRNIRAEKRTGKTD